MTSIGNNGFNPLNVAKVQKTSQTGAAAQNADAQSAPPATPPAADQAEGMMNALSAQSASNRASLGAGNRTERTMAAFQAAVTPEHHSKVMKQIHDVYAQEFGRAPSPELVSQIAGNLLVGQAQVSHP